jgi:hypothetical protein
MHFKINIKAIEFDKLYGFTKDIGLVTKEKYDEIKKFYLRRFKIS